MGASRFDHAIHIVSLLQRKDFLRFLQNYQEVRCACRVYGFPAYNKNVIFFYKYTLIQKPLARASQVLTNRITLENGLKVRDKPVPELEPE